MTEWFETFFDGVALEFWERAATADWTAAEVGFLARELNVQPGARVLDVPCGHGRHAIALAARGFAVTGIDIAERAVGRARELAREAGVVPSFERRDMRDVANVAGAPFDAAYSFGNSFGYLNDADSRAFLKAVAGVLKPGARFLLDAICAETIFSDFHDDRWMDEGDILFLSRARYDADAGRLETTYSFVQGGKRSDRRASIGIYTVRELRGMLEDAGFGAIRSLGGLDGKPFALGDPRLILSAERRS